MSMAKDTRKDGFLKTSYPSAQLTTTRLNTVGRARPHFQALRISALLPCWLGHTPSTRLANFYAPMLALVSGAFSLGHRAAQGGGSGKLTPIPRSNWQHNVYCACELWIR